MDDETAERVGKRLLDFQDAHPELQEKLGIWMASPEVLEELDQEAAALFAEEFPEVHG